MAFDIRIPIYIERVARAGSQPLYRARPLFFAVDHPRYHEREDRTIKYLHDDLRNSLNAAATEMRHDDIAAWSYCPKLETRCPTLSLSLRKQTLTAAVFLVLIESFGRRVVFSPNIPDVAFELARGEVLASRAVEVLTAHFRKLEKKSGERIDPDDIAAGAGARIDYLDLSIRGTQRFVPPKPPDPFAMLGGGEQMDGSAELERVGRCLNRFSTHDLMRAELRDASVDELDGALGDGRGACAPVVLVGPSQAGKTALVHAYVRRCLERRGAKRRETWLLSPQRMISGMMYVGQWEQRALAIFDEAAKRRHLLYFDNLLGLFGAGKSRDSDLTVGHVLKAQLEDGKLRILAEATPGAWRRLRETERGFADLFRPIFVREPSEADTARILIRTLQKLETRYSCRFESESLSLVIELSRRYARARAFPGKACEMLSQLAAGAAGGDKAIDREQVLSYFSKKTGIGRRFLDVGEKLPRESVENFFRSRIVGQDEAVEAMTDAVVLSKARLNDPDRPLASLLFLGPTGVGKTESAKAFAEYVFGDAGRLTRFDMNEHVGGDAVARLIGSPWNPTGSLTSAMHRQPHSVVLLDEIEKAAPQVFDLLLQILGDGRLTDYTGETADFCNCVVILTSNLGARGARRQLGFGTGEKSESRAYREAAEKFFRPEFFNRLDRTVAFSELERAHIAKLVKVLTARAMERSGLRGRRLILTVGVAAGERLADLGFKPEYGARALRRAVEEHLIEPLAMRIAELPGRRPAAVEIGVDADGELRFETSPFEETARRAARVHQVAPEHAPQLKERANDFIRRIEAQLEGWPEDPDGVSGQLSAHYYGLREELHGLRRTRDRLLADAERELKARQDRNTRAPSRLGKASTCLLVPPRQRGEILEGFYAAPDAATFLKQLADSAELLDPVTFRAWQLARRAARLEFLCKPRLAAGDRVLIRISADSEHFTGGMREGTHQVEHSLWETYNAYFQSYFKFLGRPPCSAAELLYTKAEAGELGGRASEATHQGDAVVPYFDRCLLYGEGPGIAELLAPEQSVQLFSVPGGAVEHCRLELFAIAPDEPIEDAFRRSFTSPRAKIETAPVTRLHHSNGFLFDLATGIVTNDAYAPLWTFIGAALPASAEFAELFKPISE